MKELQIGMKNIKTEIVDRNNIAESMGSGTLPVYATPAVAALAEGAAYKLIEPYLPEGITSVGTKINVEHIAASSIGAEITAEAVLREFDGRKYCFDITVSDNAGVVAKIYHERFTVKKDKFLMKAEQRLVQ